MSTISTFRSSIAAIDLGNLLVSDPTPLELSNLPKEEHEIRLREIACENVQLLLNKLIQLPKHQVKEFIVVKLPDGTTRIPREKPAPSARALTKWDRYTTMKGINKQKKRSRMVWDEETKLWKPRWGKGRINDVKDKWVLEVPENADPYEDQFEKLKNQKREKIAKNELQRLRNIGRNVKSKAAAPIPSLPDASQTKNDFSRAISLAEKSDASLGKFSQSAKVKDPEQYRRKIVKTQKSQRGKNKQGSKNAERRKSNHFDPKAAKERKNKSELKGVINNPAKSSGRGNRRPMKNKGSRTGNKRK